MEIKRRNLNLHFSFDQHIDTEKWPNGPFLFQKLSLLKMIVRNKIRLLIDKLLI